jgi:hypothetical protein
MAGGVADAKEDGAVEFASLGERFRAPRVPVDRIVGVLFEIRAGFVDEAIGGRGCGGHGRLRGYGEAYPVVLGND